MEENKNNQFDKSDMDKHTTPKDELTNSQLEQENLPKTDAEIQAEVEAELAALKKERIEDKLPEIEAQTPEIKPEETIQPETPIREETKPTEIKAPETIKEQVIPEPVEAKITEIETPEEIKAKAEEVIQPETPIREETKPTEIKAPETIKEQVISDPVDAKKTEIKKTEEIKAKAEEVIQPGTPIEAPKPVQEKATVSTPEVVPLNTTRKKVENPVPKAPVKQEPVTATKPTIKEIQEKNKPKYRKVVRWMWALAILGVLGIAGIFIALSFTDLPTFEELENPKSKLATNIYAGNGEVLGRYFIENRVPVTFDQLSPNLVKALIATEDLRYYKHSGIDARGLARAIAFLGSRGGASTIPQQLAKQLYTNRRARNIVDRLFQKFKEWITAVKLERSYTKEEIMAMYLNKVSYNNGAFGIRAASETYFGKEQDELALEEAAVLVGMLQNPSLYNPLTRPEKVIRRRNVVLHQMLKYGKISQAEYDKAKAAPLNMSKFKRSNHTEGLAPYFRMEMSKDVNKILKGNAVKKPDGTAYNIYKDGLKVYTTIDPVIQKYAEEAVRKKMAELQAKYWKVWKKDDPWTYIDPEKINRAKEEDEELDTETILKIRANALHKLVTQSKRYANLKHKYIAAVVAKIQEENNGLVLKDYDIERMVKEAKEPGYLKELKKANLVSAKKLSLYRKIMKSDSWMTLLAQARKLEAAAKKEFAQKTKMKIFAYNKDMETDTIMTPMDSIRYHRMILQTGLLAVEPSTGFVKAWVGGVNHKYFKYDHVRIDRQVGSTFKPFVYSTAILLQGVSPCFRVEDVPQTISPGEGSFHLEKDWTPRNANNKYTGESLTLKDGLRKSKNTVSVFLMKQLGSPMPVVNLVDHMGISKKAKRPDGRYRIPRSPSICLGAVDLQVWEMTGAYTTFANNGVFTRPVTITKIEDKNGKVLYEYMPEERSALPANVNYVMLEMLRYNLVGARGFGKIKSQVGGKTGTTNGYSDGWFMGVTPNLIVGTWVGGDDHWIHFKTISNGAGSKMARPIFVELLKKLEKNPDVYDVHAQFKRPSGDIGIELDCSKYKNPSAGGDEFFDDIESKKDSVKNNDGFDDPFGDDGDNF